MRQGLNGLSREVMYGCLDLPRGGVGGPDGEVRGDRLPPAGRGLAAARGRPKGVAAAVMTEQKLFAAADVMSGIAEESSESSRPEALDELRRSAVSSKKQATSLR